MNLDKFSIPKEVFAIINAVNRDDQQDMLLCVVMRYIYSPDLPHEDMLHNIHAIRAFERIKVLIGKVLDRARKAKARREERKAHPEKYPPRRRGNTRKAGALELPSGHVIESDSAVFDYYCIKDNKIMYFRIIGTGEVAENKASFVPKYSASQIINSLLETAPPTAAARGAMPQGIGVPLQGHRNTCPRPR